jgi:hypothetical protein
VNIANCYMQMHQPAEAITWFEAFLSESPNAPADQRDEVQRQLAELRTQVAEVHIGLSPDTIHDAVVSVDGHPTAISSNIRLSPGRHVIEATADGFQPERTEVNAAAGQRSDVVLRMRSTAQPAAVNAVATTAVTPPPANTTVPAPEPTPAPTNATSTATTTTTAESSAPPMNDVVDTRPHDNRTLSPAFFFTGVAVTGVALVSFASFGIAALVSNGTYESARSNIQNGTYTNLQDEQTRGLNAIADTNTFKVVADVSLGVTVAAAATTIFLFTRTRFGNHPNVAIAPMGGAGTGGIVIGGTF